MNAAYPISPAPWLTGHRAAWRSAPLAFLNDERRRHGGPFRFRLGTQTLLVVSDGPSADAILRANAASFAKPPLLSRFGEGFFGHALTALDGPAWREGRGAIPTAFGVGTQPSLGPVNPSLLTGDVVHSLSAIFAAAFARWLLHVELCDAAEHALSIARSLDALDEHVSAGVPWPSWFPLRRLAILGRERDRQRALVGGWLRKAPADAPLVRALARFDPETRLDNVNIAIGLGAHQTALAASWTLLELSRCPAYQERIAGEIVAPADRPNAASRAVLEALRLHPPFYAIVRRALSEIILPCGPVPRGATVMVSVHLLHRDPALFDEPDAFSPDRWNEPDRPGTFLPFGAGPRACIARHLLVPFLSDFVGKLLRDHDVCTPRAEPVSRAGVALRFDRPFGFGFRSRTGRALDPTGHDAYVG